MQAGSFFLFYFILVIFTVPNFFHKMLEYKVYVHVFLDFPKLTKEYFYNSSLEINVKQGIFFIIAHYHSDFIPH